MARLTSFPPFEFLRRLGIKDRGEVRLDLIDAIQPVIGVGDVSAFFPPLLAPSAWAGGTRNGVALERGTFQITAGPRGTLIRQLHLSLTVSQPYVFEITTTPEVLGNLIVPEIQDMSERGNQGATFTLGTTLVSIQSNTIPMVMVSANNTHVIEDGFYIASGRTLQIQSNGVNEAARFAVLAQDAFGPEPLA